MTSHTNSGLSIAAATEENYVGFTIRHGDGSTGSADLRIRELEDSHFLSRCLQREGVKQNSLVAEMFFYPHSHSSPRRAGIGTEVLNCVLNDALARGVQAVYVEATNVEARNFFLKQSFANECHGQLYKRV